MDGKVIAGAWAGFTFMLWFAFDITPLNDWRRADDLFAAALIPAVIAGLLQARSRSRGGQ